MLSRTRGILRTILLRLFGTGAPLIFGDSMVLDRWRWLKRYLPETADQELLIDIGCGTGAFTAAAANRGYTALGLTWNERDQVEAQLRAEALGLADRVKFIIYDVRRLDQFKKNIGEWSYVICCENIEHIIDDAKLIRDIVNIMKSGGRLLMTTPNYYYRPLNKAYPVVPGTLAWGWFPLHNSAVWHGKWRTSANGSPQRHASGRRQTRAWDNGISLL